MNTVKLIILIFIFTVSIKTNAQNSVVLDSTFGVNGKTSTTISPEGYLNSLPSSIRQDDGKIIVAYQFSNYPVLLRYLPDGDLDSTWGQNGIVRAIDSTTQRNVVLDLHLLANNQVLLTGYQLIQSGGYDNFIIKYNSDGSLDQSFGINGTANYAHPIDIIPSPSATLFTPRSSFVLGAKIYIAGTDNLQNKYGFIAFDLNTGALDNTFGNIMFCQLISDGVPIVWVEYFVVRQMIIKYGPLLGIGFTSYSLIFKPIQTEGLEIMDLLSFLAE